MVEVKIDEVLEIVLSDVCFGNYFFRYLIVVSYLFLFLNYATIQMKRIGLKSGDQIFYTRKIS